MKIYIFETATKNPRRFWAGPIVLVIANFVFDDWYRKDIVQAVDFTVMTWGFIVILVIFQKLV